MAHKVEIIIAGKDQASGPLGRVGSALGGIAKIAGGILAANVFSRITSGLAGLVTGGIEAAGTMQNLQIAFEGLAAREIARETGDLAGAMEDAVPIAADLLEQIRELSIVSPFEYETVVNATRLQMAFGATVEEAIPLTKALLDTAAGLGLTTEAADRLTYNFGQIRSVGQIMGTDLRQLRMVGLDLADVFKSQLGLSVEEVNQKLKDGKLTMEDVSQAFIRYAEENFGGAAERMSRTFQGLKSSIKDLAFFGGADLLGPALEVVSEALGGLFDKARDLMDSGVLRDIGQALGSIVEGMMAGDVQGVFSALMDALSSIGVPQGLLDVVDALSPFFQAIKELLQGDFEDAIFNFAAGIGELGEALGLWDSETAMEVSEAILQVADGIKLFADGVGALIEGNRQEGLGKIAVGISEVGAAILGWDEEKTMAVRASLYLFGDAVATAADNFGILVDTITQTAYQSALDWWAQHEPEVTEAIDSVAASVGRLVEAFSLSPEEESGITKFSDLTAAVETLVYVLTQEAADRALQRLQEFADILEIFSYALEGWQGLVTLWTTPLGEAEEGTGKFSSNIIKIFLKLQQMLVGHSIVPDMIEDIVDAFFKLPGDAANAIESNLGNMVKAGKAIVEGMKQGIEEKWDGFIGWILSKMGEILGAIMEFFNMGSPAKALIPVGAALPPGIAIGWSRAFPGLQQTISGDLRGLGFGGGAGGMMAGAGAGGMGGGSYTFNVYDRQTAAYLAHELADRQRSQSRSWRMGV